MVGFLESRKIMMQNAKNIPRKEHLVSGVYIAIGTIIPFWVIFVTGFYLLDVKYVLVFMIAVTITSITTTMVGWFNNNRLIKKYNWK